VYLLFLRNFYFGNYLNNTKSQQILLTFSSCLRIEAGFIYHQGLQIYTVKSGDEVMKRRFL
jgi:hypothetical protein